MESSETPRTDTVQSRGAQRDGSSSVLLGRAIFRSAVLYLCFGTLSSLVGFAVVVFVTIGSAKGTFGYFTEVTLVPVALAYFAAICIIVGVSLAVLGTAIIAAVVQTRRIAGSTYLSLRRFIRVAICVTGLMPIVVTSVAFAITRNDVMGGLALIFSPLVFSPAVAWFAGDWILAARPAKSRSTA